MNSTVKTITYSCPACGQAMEARSTMAGQWTSCTACGQQFKVPKRTSLLTWLLLLAALVIAAAVAYTIFFSFKMDQLTH